MRPAARSMSGHFQFRPASATRKNFPKRVMTATCAVCTVKKLSRAAMMIIASNSQDSIMLDSKGAAALADGLYAKSRRADQRGPARRFSTGAPPADAAGQDNPWLPRTRDCRKSARELLHGLDAVLARELLRLRDDIGNDLGV